MNRTEHISDVSSQEDVSKAFAYTKEELEAVAELKEIKLRTEFSFKQLSYLYRISQHTLAKLHRHSYAYAKNLCTKLKEGSHDINLILENASNVKQTPYNVKEEMVKRLMLKSKIQLTEDQMMEYYGK